MMWKALSAGVHLLLSTAYGWEMYGSHVAYEKGHELTVKGSSISTVTGPFYGFYEGPAFCEPKGGLGSGEDYLGEILMGSRLVNTPITFKVMEEQKCVPLCDPSQSQDDGSFNGFGIKPSSTAELRKFPRAEVMVDTLPIISKMKYRDLPFQIRALIGKADPETLYYAHGVPIYDSIGLIMNHWKIQVLVEPTVSYHVEGGLFGIGGEQKNVEKYTIVGVIVTVESVANIDECRKTDDESIPFNPSGDTPLQWFYSVDFVEVKDLTYTTRWNNAIAAIQHGLATIDGKSAFGNRENKNMQRWIDVILDTSLLAVFLVLLVSSVMARMLKRDFDQETETVLGEEMADMSTWKLLKADVFRKPAHSTILCALVGGGLQIVLALVPVALALMTGIIPEQHKGRIIQLGIVSWAFAGLPSGYAVCRLYRMFDSPNWKLTVLRTGLMIPGCSLLWALLINVTTYCLSIFDKSHVPRVLDTWALIRLTCFWVFFSLPLVSAGCYLGLRSAPIEPPVKPSKIPRPAPSMNFSYFVIILTSGSLIHASSMALVDCLLKALLQDYNSDGALQVSITFLIWCLLTGLASVCVTFYLINDDVWSWWWYAYLAPASCGFWIALLLMVESKYRVHSLLESVVYAGILGVVASGFALIAGAIGFLSSLGFVFYIYSRIRVD